MCLGVNFLVLVNVCGLIREFWELECLKVKGSG